MNSFKVDISPGMGEYRLKQAYPYSVQTALAEFVDNSIQSYIDNENAIAIIDKQKNNLKIKISINSSKKELVISRQCWGNKKRRFSKGHKTWNRYSTSRKRVSLNLVWE